MDAGYELSVVDRVLQLVFRGKLDFETTERAIAEGAKVLTEQGIDTVLFDFAAADPNGYIAETVRHAERAERLGLSRNLRLAFYGGHSRDTVEFMATVASNRGYVARAFANRDDALHWLKQPAP
jgi:hypothetical protein